MANKIIETYSHYVAHHSFIVLLVVALLTVGALRSASMIQTEGTAFTKMFPKDLEVMKTLSLAQDEFGGITGVTIAVEVDDDAMEPNSISDVREPRVMSYVDVLAAKSKKVENVIQASSAADIVKSRNNGIIPDSLNTIIATLSSSPEGAQYISRDYKMSLVRVSLGNVEEKEKQLVNDMREVIATTAAPQGIKAGLTGEPTMSVVFQESTGPDMERTSKYSFIGILAITIIIFSSIRHGLIPIVSVTLGLMWAFGLMGMLNIRMSSQMAGFASMVMGIGIDFAIQVVNRYREEMAGRFEHNRQGKEDKQEHASSAPGTSIRAHETPEQALAFTLSNVIAPMGTTTLAALIGFQAMSLGTLKIMEQLGRVMSLGVLTSMVAAITLVPALIIIGEKIK